MTRTLPVPLVQTLSGKRRGRRGARARRWRGDDLHGRGLAAPSLAQAVPDAQVLEDQDVIGPQDRVEPLAQAAARPLRPDRQAEPLDQRSEVGLVETCELEEQLGSLDVQYIAGGVQIH